MTHDWEAEHAKRTSWGVWPAEYMVRAVADYKGPRQAALDIGSGGGAHVRLLQEAGFHNVWAQDISQTAVDRIKEMAKDPQLVACGGINDMVYDPGEFDIIMDNLSLTHVEAPRFDKIVNWLRPGGLFLTAVLECANDLLPKSWCHPGPSALRCVAGESMSIYRWGGSSFTIRFTAWEKPL